MEYKYKVEDYKDYGTLPFSMEDFYTVLGRYKKGEVSVHYLEKACDDLFFSIKHRVVEGSFSPPQAEEMRAYFRGLL